MRQESNEQEALTVYVPMLKCTNKSALLPKWINNNNKKQLNISMFRLILLLRCCSPLTFVIVEFVTRQNENH